MNSNHSPLHQTSKSIQTETNSRMNNTPPIYPNWYKVLRLSSTEDLHPNEIHTAYLTQTALHDPNQFMIGTEDYKRSMTYSKIIKHAYEVLSHPDRKEAYDVLRYQIRSKFDKDQLIQRSKTLAESWLKSTESKTRSTEESLTSELAKKRLNEFDKTHQSFKLKYPTLPPLRRESVSEFFKLESKRREEEIRLNRISHQNALELMILAEFERRSIGMKSTERKLKWKIARDEFKKISHQRHSLDQQRSQLQWESSLRKFFNDHLNHHLNHSNHQSTSNPSSSIQDSSKFDKLQSPVTQKRRVSINLERPHLYKPETPLGS
ncbi:hypothetical protein DFH28DRAFT_924609 [Melampsora americana]|nr:hypothetical protein DFH28DRAFT_924609 [Melampsora americana]